MALDLPGFWWCAHCSCSACSSWGGRGWGLGQGLGTGQRTLGWHQISCVPKLRTHPWSQARSDNSATSLSPSVAYVTLPTDSDYTMQEFALRYFRKPQTL